MKRINQTSTLTKVLLLGVFVLSVLGSDCFARSAEEIAKFKAAATKVVPKIEAAAPAKPAVKPLRERKLLVINLCNDFYHESIPYWDKALEAMGDKTGAWKTTVSSDMSMFKRENLHKFDAVCFNNTTKLKFDDELKKTLMDFIKGGKGIVGIHAASDNFYDWPEAAELMGGQFSGHPWTSGGTWAIKLDDPDHPLMAAFGGKGFKLKEEIYRTAAPLYSRTKQRVLMSLDMSDATTSGIKNLKPGDKDTGISWIKTKGRGRLFYCSIGHNPELCWNPTILQHYIAGIQFALGDLLVDATPGQQRPVEDILAEIKNYEYGKSRLALSELTDMIRSSGDSSEKLAKLEQSFIKFLGSDATDQSKQFICRQLSIIGTEKSVPTLAAMLTLKASSEIEPADMARYALERIPGIKADKALRDAMDKTQGNVKIGIINSIGARGDDIACEKLGALTANSNEQMARAALSALGNIGTENAARTLKNTRANLDAKLGIAWGDAYLLCADTLIENEEKATAYFVYRKIYIDPNQPKLIRIAALRGLVLANPLKGSGAINKILSGKNQTMQTTAISLLREVPNTTITPTMIELMPKLSGQSQIQMLAAIGERKERATIPVVLKAAASPKVSVRIAALEALGKFGGTKHIDFLAQRAATTQSKEQQAARQALYRLSGMGIDLKIMMSISKVEPEVQIELIKAAAERNIKVLTLKLLEQMEKSEYQDVRIEALRALQVVGHESHIDNIIRYMVIARSDADRTEAENTVAAIARTIKDENRKTDEVLSALANSQDSVAKSSLLRILGKIGGAQALGAMVQALDDEDSEVKITAIRVLSEWPNAKPIESLRKVAKSAGNQKQLVLSLRGFIRMIGIGNERTDAEKLSMYKEAMSLAPNANEKKPVLSGLGNVRTIESLQTVATYLDDAALGQEASAASVSIAESIRQKNPEQVKTVLQKVLQVSKNDSVKERAQRIIDQMK